MKKIWYFFSEFEGILYLVQKVLRKCVVKVLNFLNNCGVSIRKLNGTFMYILYGIFSGKNGYMYEKIDLLK